MINLIVSVFGGLLVIGGFYLMYLGFNIPPNPIAFFLGLIASVFGLILMIFFGSRIDLSKGAMPRPKKVKAPKSAATAQIKPKKMPVKDKIPSKSATINDSRVIKPKPRPKEEPKFGPSSTSTPPIKKEKAAPVGKAITPKKKTETPPSTFKPQKKDAAPTNKSTTLPPDLATKPKTQPKKIAPKKIAPVKKATTDEGSAIKKEDKAEKPHQVKPFRIKPKTDEKGKTDEKVVPAPKSVLETADKERLKELQTRTGRDDQFVKNRLDKLKENYIQNAKDIEGIIDERLDSFKGTIDKLKTDSTEPSIIWSFEAHDVQEAMKDTIVTAENKLLMMYPWVRNIDVSILKKFMDTQSRMIIQEASLDDDASVELIKLLQDKDVKIRTMPHVHTVAIVADEVNGLIISTDPIYESYEVGVIYKDKKSILEIERMFEDAWSISQDVDLELKK
ncbi:hypothetical protein [Methanobacterium formicicum]|uniref:DUF308 domain-containing protein n=1 Tax=Methanobacterium formicicum (strain DSM 3637 / PP1) TaxID=1204725 RepID=K2QDB0_METFP|nr:hypothetical protein [Methanobacterium formicicum]EKF86011.1 hypothetical protein A994_05976 [Methanobacterium formicicum DSM 3637]